VVSAPRGHSLPELLVTLVFLGVALGSVGSAGLLGGRWTADAVLRQEALAACRMVADSLVRLPVQPASGGRDEGDPRWRVEWWVSAAGASADPVEPAAPVAVAVTARSHRDGERPLVTLHALWTPAPPRLGP
jgi:Tfp pilus assembly protein PilV